MPSLGLLMVIIVCYVSDWIRNYISFHQFPFVTWSDQYFFCRDPTRLNEYYLLYPMLYSVCMVKNKFEIANNVCINADKMSEVAEFIGGQWNDSFVFLLNIRSLSNIEMCISFFRRRLWNCPRGFFPLIYESQKVVSSSTSIWPFKYPITSLSSGAVFCVRLEKAGVRGR